MIPYMARTRRYYQTLGYPPYEWAHFDDVPFAVPARRVNASNLVLITTAAPHRAELGDQGPGAAYNAGAKFFQVYSAAVDPAPDLRISHLGYDRLHTTAEDSNTWLPLSALKAAVVEGTLGWLAERLIGVPTNRSQRVTMEQDAPAALDLCRELDAHMALLVPS